MPEVRNIIQTVSSIKGVEVRECRGFADSRGSFTEVFRAMWVSGCSYTSEIQLNLSRTGKNALRGLHYHHRQHDWWVPVSGVMQVVLADLREDSQTFGKKAVFRLSAEDSMCILIPPGVAHGFLALTDVTLLYAVDRYYDGTDEQGVAWNDPVLSVQWENPSPILSKRDQNNPGVEELRLSRVLPG